MCRGIDRIDGGISEGYDDDDLRSSKALNTSIRTLYVRQTQNVFVCTSMLS